VGIAKTHPRDRASCPPRGMRREAAAEYIGIGATKFRTLARDPTTNCKGI